MVNLRIKVAVASTVALLLGLAFQAIRPPPPAILGSPGGPTVTSPRVRLKDGRYLAYKEAGVDRETARFKIIFSHGFDSTKESGYPVSQELAEELGMYLLFFDRAGYGDSDTNPRRGLKSDATDIEELADALKLGEKFYVVGCSMGGYTAWSCLRYIPQRPDPICSYPLDYLNSEKCREQWFLAVALKSVNCCRLAGVALVVPAVNYFWPLPANVSRSAFEKLDPRDRRTFWIAHHTPSLFYAWLTQKWFPMSPIVRGEREAFTDKDWEILTELRKQSQMDPAKATQQGTYESLVRDATILFGNWDFDPTEIENPFPNGKGVVSIWQGYEDKIVRVEIQRYLAQKLPWVRYHEHPEAGHALPNMDRVGDDIIRELLLGEPPNGSQSEPRQDGRT